MEVGLGSGDSVFDGDPATFRKKGTPTPTKFVAHVYCGQMAGWINTPLGTEVDLSTGHTVLDVVPAVRKRGTTAPSFRPCLLWPRSPISATAELLLKKATLLVEAMVNRKNVFFLLTMVEAELHYTPLLNLTLWATNGMLVAFKNIKTALEGCEIKS